MTPPTPARRHAFLLGAAKCGTTSLARWLHAQPGVCVSTPEPQFFPLEHERGPEHYWSTYFAPRWQGEELVVDDQHRNLYLPFVADLIQAAHPDARSVVILRDPVARAFSHWWHRRMRGQEDLELAEAIEADLQRLDAGVDFTGPAGMARWRDAVGPATSPRFSAFRTYLDTGHYAPQLRRYLDRFGSAAVKVVFLEEVSADPAGQLRAVADHLGFVPADLELPKENSGDRRRRHPVVVGAARRVGALVPADLRRRTAGRVLYRAAPRPAFDPAVRSRLTDHYRPFNQALAELLGRPLPEPWTT